MGDTYDKESYLDESRLCGGPVKMALRLHIPTVQFLLPTPPDLMDQLVTESVDHHSTLVTTQ